MDSLKSKIHFQSMLIDRFLNIQLHSVYICFDWLDWTAISSRFNNFRQSIRDGCSTACSSGCSTGRLHQYWCSY